MEAMNSIRGRAFSIALAALTATSLLLAACGSDVIRGRPPLVGLSELVLVGGDRLDAGFRIANQNGVPMTISRAEIAVSVRDAELIAHAQALNLGIDANGAEDLRVEQAAEPFTLTLLSSLDNGELQSLAFDLTGSVRTTEDGVLQFAYTGYLYPVPGRPGHYRSAVTQANELRREDPL